MSEAKNISNEILLVELSKRIEENQIKFEYGKLVGKSEKNEYSYFAIPLNIDVGKLVNEVIGELKEERDLMVKEKERWEKELRKTVSK